jgi:aspartate/methionine/tyrosine aminotransferase
MLEHRMELPPFLLDHWMAAHEFATPPIRYNLASSTGPKWSVGEVLRLGNASLDNIGIGYAPPQGSRELRETIAAFLNVDPEWVLTTTGASEAISALFCLAARPGANVVLPSPDFPAFDAMAGVWGIGVNTYALAREAGFAQSPDAVLAAADAETVLAVINTPHNPAGTVMPHAGIAQLAEKLGERGIPLIVDEVYHPLYFGNEQPSAATLDNVIVMGDMSKAMSLPGTRLGWLTVRDPKLRERIIDARSYFTISGSPVMEAIATQALLHRDAVLGRLREAATANLALLSAALDRAANKVRWVKPEGGTLAFPWFRDGRDSRPFCEAVARAGLLIVPGDCYGMPDHFRIGIGAQESDYGEALALFERVLAEQP